MKEAITTTEMDLELILCGAQRLVDSISISQTEEGKDNELL